MYVKNDFDFGDLKQQCWSGAVSTLERIEELGLEEELMNLLEDIFFDNMPTMTELNDLLWFEEDYIMQALGVTEDDED